MIRGSLSTARAGWQSGYAAACKAVYAGSIPTPASIFLITLGGSGSARLSSQLFLNLRDAFWFRKPAAHTVINGGCPVAWTIFWTNRPASVIKSGYAFFPVRARVVELVDTRDLKSLGGNSVPVRVRPWAPLQSTGIKPLGTATFRPRKTSGRSPEVQRAGDREHCPRSGFGSTSGRSRMRFSSSAPPA